MINGCMAATTGVVPVGTDIQPLRGWENQKNQGQLLRSQKAAKVKVGPAALARAKGDQFLSIKVILRFATGERSG